MALERRNRTQNHTVLTKITSSQSTQNSPREMHIKKHEAQKIKLVEKRPEQKLTRHQIFTP